MQALLFVTDLKIEPYYKAKNIRGNENIPKAIYQSIVSMCSTLPITKIVAVTISGYSARMVASAMLPHPIIAISNDELAARSFNLLRNTKGVFIDIDFAKDSLDHILLCLEYLYKNKEVDDDDVVLLTALGYPNTGRRMNMLQTHYIKDLKELFKW